MAKYPIDYPATFTETAEKLTTETKGHADNFNPLFQQLFNNDAFLKEVTDLAVRHMENSNIHVTKEELKTGLEQKADKKDKGVASGYASLDTNAKIPLKELPDAVLGNVSFQSLWDPSTNTPTLPTTPTTKGHYYICTANGTRFGISFETGDWLIANGSNWGKVDNTDAVMSVAGRTGNVTLTKADVGITIETYTATIGTSWTGTTAPYTQDITVKGIVAGDNPSADILLSSNLTTAQAEEKALNCISKIVTSTDKITVYCNKKKPITAMNIQLKVVR